MKIQFFSIRKKLFMAVMIASLVITTVVVGLTFVYEYKKEMATLEAIPHEVETGALLSLSQSIWDYNDAQIDAQLTNLINRPEIASVDLQLREGKGNRIFRDVDHASSSGNIFKTLDLSILRDGKSYPLGQMILELDRNQALNKIYNKFAMIVLLQSLQTFLTSFILLYLFQSLVTSRLETISHHFEEISGGDLKKSHRLSVRRQKYLGWG